MDQIRGYYTIADLAEAFGVSKATISYWINTKKLIPLQMSRFKLLRSREILDFVAAFPQHKKKLKTEFLEKLRAEI